MTEENLEGWETVPLEIPSIWKQKLQRNADKLYDGDISMEIRYHIRKLLDI